MESRNSENSSRDVSDRERRVKVPALEGDLGQHGLGLMLGAGLGAVGEDAGLVYLRGSTWVPGLRVSDPVV